MKQTRNKGGRPAKSKAQKQDYRITIRLNTELNFRLKALARESVRPRTETVRQLIAYG